MLGGEGRVGRWIGFRVGGFLLSCKERLFGMAFERYVAVSGESMELIASSDLPCLWCFSMFGSVAMVLASDTDQSSK